MAAARQEQRLYAANARPLNGRLVSACDQWQSLQIRLGYSGRLAGKASVLALRKHLRPLHQGAMSAASGGPRRFLDICKLALRRQAWQPERVRKRPFQRCSAVLGVLAMLGALLVAPVSTPMALAMVSSMGHVQAAAASDEMPCHKPAKPKHCPGCPQKMCADMTACLAKCFQALSAPVTQAHLHGLAPSSVILPGPARASDGSLIPPLLRPPSV